MKKYFYFVALFLFTLISCEKAEEEKTLIGDWNNTENSFLLEVNDNVDFVDLFSNPWKGEIKIDGKNITVKNIHYSIDNVFGDHHLFSDSIGITIYSNLLAISYKNMEYILTDNFSVDLEKGTLLADGVASSGEQKIAVVVNLSAEHISMQKGRTYELHDAQYYLKSPYTKLSFSSDGKMTGTIMDIDMLFIIDGKWELHSNQLNISVSDRSIDEDYALSFNGDDAFELIKDIEYSNSAIYGSIPASKVKKVSYRIGYKRSEE